MNSYITLKDIRKTIESGDENATAFDNLYRKLISHHTLNEDESDNIIRIIALLMYYGDEDVREMAYYISLHLGAITKDYTILYEISKRLRFFPIMKKLENSNRHNPAAYDLDAYVLDGLANVLRSEYYVSEEQFYFMNDTLKNTNVKAIAPTSYGKSHVMAKKCLSQYSHGKKVCIVVPTKSLVSQTARNLALQKGDRRDIYVHPEALSSSQLDKPHIAVFTQERLIYILARNQDFSYDYIFVDEAHNLFSRDKRALILCRALMLTKARNVDLNIDYYSPFVVDPNNSLSVISVNNEKDVVVKVAESMKVPQYFIWSDTNCKISVYDQYLNTYMPYANSSSDVYEVTAKLLGNKNVLYANKPSDIEQIADNLANFMPEVKFSSDSQQIIDDACRALSASVHGTYNLIKLLKHGIAISHGRMPDSIKTYSEVLFGKVPELKVMVTSSTLLEGVNIPAEKLFIFDFRKGKSFLSSSMFHNLVGRICRLSYAFNGSDFNIDKITPKIYIMDTMRFRRERTDIFELFAKRANKSVNQKDEIDNPLLEGYKGQDKDGKRIHEAITLSNLDKNNSKQYEKIGDTPVVLAKTRFGELCFKNGVTMFDIFTHEAAIDAKLSREATIANGDDLMRVIVNDILKPTYEPSHRHDWVYKLFLNEKFQYVILGILKDRIAGEYNFSNYVARSIAKWSKSMTNGGSIVAYVGAMGSCGRDGSKTSGGSYFKFYNGNENLMASYAIGLQKDTLDSIENELMPIVEVLNDLGKIEDDCYKLIKYGTKDDIEISLIRTGIEQRLANLIAKDSVLLECITFSDGLADCIDRDKLINRLDELNVDAISMNAIEGVF